MNPTTKDPKKEANPEDPKEYSEDPRKTPITEDLNGNPSNRNIIL